MERDERGRFVKGNKASPGRPPRQMETDYLEVTASRVTVARWGEIVDKALADAAKGDSRARSWLSEYLMRRPPQYDELTGRESIVLAWLLRELKTRGIAPLEFFEMALEELKGEADGEQWGERRKSNSKTRD